MCTLRIAKHKLEAIFKNASWFLRSWRSIKNSYKKPWLTLCCVFRPAKAWLKTIKNAPKYWKTYFFIMRTRGSCKAHVQNGNKWTFRTPQPMHGPACLSTKTPIPPQLKMPCRHCMILLLYTTYISWQKIQGCYSFYW